MRKDAHQKHKNLLKLNLQEDTIAPQQKGSRKSLLDDDDYCFETPDSLSEFTKLYLGKPSAFDKTDPTEEFYKATKLASKEKGPASKPKSYRPMTTGRNLLSVRN